MEKRKNIPELRFPEFDGDWKRKSVGDISKKVGSGSTPLGGSKTYQAEGIVFIRSQNVNSDVLNLEDVVFISEQINDKMAGSKVLAEDILLNITGASIGRSCVVPKDFQVGNVNQHVCIIRLHQDYSPYFFQPFLSSDRGQKLVFQEQAGGGREGLNFQSIRKFKAYFPSLLEQQKIASFFTAIDKKISQLKLKKSLLEQYKKGVMQKIFSQQIRFRDENGKEFPKWEKKKLGEVIIEHLEKNNGNRYSEVFSVAKHKGVINQIEHLGRSYSAKEISHYKVIFPNDIVYTKSPTSEFPFGIIKQNMTNRTGVVSPLYGVFKPLTPSLGFLLHNYFLSWINTYNYLNPLVQKGAKNTMNINNNDFLSGAKLNLPVSEKEQTKIANFLSAIDAKINHTQTQIENAERWKKGLLQKMFV